MSRTPRRSIAILAPIALNCGFRRRVANVRALNTSRRVFAGRDALGSGRLENKETAIRRMEREIVTTEMVVFEWLGTAKTQPL